MIRSDSDVSAWAVRCLLTGRGELQRTRCTHAQSHVLRFAHTCTQRSRTMKRSLCIRVRKWSISIPNSIFFHQTENSIVCGCVLGIERPTLSALARAIRVYSRCKSQHDFLNVRCFFDNTCKFTCRRQRGLRDSDCADAVSLRCVVQHARRRESLLDSTPVADRDYRFENSEFHPNSPFSLCNAVESILGQFFLSHLFNSVTEVLTLIAATISYLARCMWMNEILVLDSKTVVHLPLATPSISCAHIIEHERTQRNKHQNCLNQITTEWEDASHSSSRICSTCVRHTDEHDTRPCWWDNRVNARAVIVLSIDSMRFLSVVGLFFLCEFQNIIIIVAADTSWQRIKGQSRTT